MEQNKGTTDIWSVPAGGGKAVRVTDPGNNESSVQWSADGKKIYFLSDRTGSGQVWSAAPSGNNLAQVTDIEGGVEGFSVAPSGRPDSVYQACAGREAELVGALFRSGTVQGENIRRSDGAPLGLLGRRKLPAPVRRRHGRPGDRRDRHHGGRAVGRSAGSLFRCVGDRMEPCGHSACLYLQETDGYAVRAEHRLGHLSLRRSLGPDEQSDRGNAGLRQVSRLFARRFDDRFYEHGAPGQRVG